MDYDNMIFGLGLAVAFSAIVLVIFGAAYLLTASECSTYGITTGLETKMSGRSCYVNDGNRWSAWEEFKLRQMCADAK